MKNWLVVANAARARVLEETDVRDREHDRFAQEVAAALNDAVAHGQCAGLVVVASNPFLGQLKAHLNERAHAAVLRTVPNDYTSLSDTEIARRLAAPLPNE